MASRLAASLLAVIVVLSGCLGSAAVVTAPAVPGAQATAPAEERAVPQDGSTADSRTTQEDENDTLPPGLNESGVEDPSALVEAHRTALEDTGFSFRFRANVSVGPASQWTVQRGTAEAGLSPLVIHSASVRRIGGDATDFATDLWANDSTVAVEHTRENRTRLGRYDRAGDDVGVPDETWAHLPRADLGSQATQSWLLELALTAGDYDLVRTERRDGRTVSVLRATEPVAGANFTDFDATVVVDAAGRVHNLTVSATYEGDDAASIDYAFDLTEVGGVEVERPEWVGEATPPEQDGNETGTDGGETTTSPATTGTADR